MPSASFPGPLRKLAALPSPEKTCAVAGSTVGEGWADGVFSLLTLPSPPPARSCSRMPFMAASILSEEPVAPLTASTPSNPCFSSTACRMPSSAFPKYSDSFPLRFFASNSVIFPSFTVTKTITSSL